MKEIKYPTFFRILAPFNLLIAIILGFLLVLIFLDVPKDYLFVSAFSIAAFWLLVSAFAWFFASVRSYTFLYTTLFSLLILAGALLFYAYTLDPPNKNTRSGMSIISLILLVYSAFSLMGLFYSPVKNWQTAQKNNKPYAPNLAITAIFLISVALSFSWLAYANQSDTFSSEPDQNIDTTAFEEIDDEPPMDIPERDFPIETLVEIYSGFTIDSTFKYDYGSPYLETTEQIIINGKQYGEFVGGPDALMKELMVSIMANQGLKFDNYRATYDYTIRTNCIASLSQEIPLYNNYEELLEKQRLYQRYVFQNINLQLVAWGARNFIPDPHTIINDHEAQEIYRIVFRRFFRLMAMSYQHINYNYNIQEETSWYMDKARDEQSYMPSELRDRYPGVLQEYEIENCPYSYFKPAHAVGFWIRRNMDGTDQALFNALRALMLEYDYEWWTDLFEGQGE